jgi:hypothetical protein
MVHSKLNIFTAPEDTLRHAFDSMEFRGFYDDSKKGGSSVDLATWKDAHSRIREHHQMALDELERVKKGGQSDTPDLYEDTGMSREAIIAELEKDLERFGPDRSIGMSIYGKGGINRYTISYGGDIYFSADHANYPKDRTVEKARSLGFGVRGMGY